MDFPADLKYTREHEWARQEGGEITVGITSHAQAELGDIVFLELPEVGAQVEQGKTFGVVESVKAVSDLYSPVSGQVVRINADLVDAPERVNADPYGAGWMIAIESSGAGADLLSAAEYEKFVKEEKEK
jgi:glycine cleavage system H protein